MAASRVIAREYPNITCRVIDVAGGATGTDASETTGRVVRELGASEAIDLVALRGPHRWLPVFQPVRLAAPSTPGRISTGASTCLPAAWVALPSPSHVN